jgi:allantoinase
MWTNALAKGLQLDDVHRLLTTNTSRLAGLSTFKGSIEVGKDADFVIWNPDASFKVTEDIIQHKNKVGVHPLLALF